MKEQSGLLKGTRHWKDVWKYARTVLGGQCAILDGVMLMQEWFVDSLDYQLQVSILSIVCAV